jgi:hypothetical protein
MKQSTYQLLKQNTPDEDTTGRKRGLLRWWINMTAPAELPRSAPLRQREAVRRGRLASVLLFFLILALLAVLVIGTFGSNHLIIPAALIMFMLVLVAIECNRRGYMNIAGLFLSLGYDAAIFSVILTYPGGLTPSILGLYDMLLISEIFFVTLLPLNWVFLSLILNITFIVTDLLLQPGSATFQAMMMGDRIAVISRPIMLHVIITAVLYFWIRNNQREMMRADRAEDLAALQQERVREKEQLQTGIETIQQALVHVANGDFSAQVPLAQENILWQVAISINTLLARIQSARKNEEQINKFIEQLTQVLQNYLMTRRLPAMLPLPPRPGPTTKLVNTLQLLLLARSANHFVSRRPSPPLDPPPSNNHRQN